MGFISLLFGKYFLDTGSDNLDPTFVTNHTVKFTLDYDTISQSWFIHYCLLDFSDKNPYQNLCLSADITTGGGLTIAKCDHSLKQTFKFELKDIKA